MTRSTPSRPRRRKPDREPKSIRRKRPEPLKRFSRNELAAIVIATTLFSIDSGDLAQCVETAKMSVSLTEFQAEKILRWLMAYERGASGYIRFFPKIICSEILEFEAASQSLSIAPIRDEKLAQIQPQPIRRNSMFEDYDPAKILEEHENEPVNVPHYFNLKELKYAVMSLELARIHETDIIAGCAEASQEPVGMALDVDEMNHIYSWIKFRLEGIEGDRLEPWIFVLKERIRSIQST